MPELGADDLWYRVRPFPARKRFAVTFVDDTDLSTRENTEPVYKMLGELGMRGAKTVWVWRPRRASAFRRGEERAASSSEFGQTLEDADYREFVLGLRDHGFEIALHNVAAGNSYRQEIDAGLERFLELFGTYPRLNAFHARNRENLYAGSGKLDSWLLKFLERIVHRSNYEGHVEGSPYFWGDLAQKHIHFTRLPFHTIKEVNTLKLNPSMPFFDPRRPYVNSWFACADGADRRRFVALLSPGNIARLEHEGGACIVYTHFAKGFAPKVNGHYRVSSDFASTVDLLSRNRSGWYPNPSELLARLRTCKKIRFHQTGHALRISNMGEKALEDLVIEMPKAVCLTFPDQNRGEARRGEAVIGKLEAKETLDVVCEVAADHLWQPVETDEIGRKERMGIEIANYVGLIEDVKFFRGLAWRAREVRD